MQIETVDDFKRIGEDLYGYGWQTRLANTLGVDGSSVRRWVGSALPLPPYVTAFLGMMAQRQEALGRVAFYEYPVGKAVRMMPAPAHTLEKMRQRFAFTGTEQRKPFPAIHAKVVGGHVEVSQDGAAKDEIKVDDVLFVQVRHPDSFHLAGYLAAAQASGFAPSVVSHRHHHYTVLATRGAGGKVERIIHTHAGVIRHIQDTMSVSD